MNQRCLGLPQCRSRRCRASARHRALRAALDAAGGVVASQPTCRGPPEALRREARISGQVATPPVAQHSRTACPVISTAQGRGMSGSQQRYRPAAPNACTAAGHRRNHGCCAATSTATDAFREPIPFRRRPAIDAALAIVAGVAVRRSVLRDGGRRTVRRTWSAGFSTRVLPATTSRSTTPYHCGGDARRRGELWVAR
jgi:hypothetical protein